MPPAKKISGIKSWAKDDRPREKLFAKGAAALSDAELLAIIIGNGHKEKSALDLAQEILNKAKRNWNELGKLSITDLKKIKGIGQAKAIIIAAVMEIGRRRQSGKIFEKPVIRNGAQAAEFLKPMLADNNREVFCVLFLNRTFKMNHVEIFSQGGIDGTVVDIRLILKKALEVEATTLLLCHNHPSGNTKPSYMDTALTKKLKDAAHAMDINIMDHVIVSEEGFYSFAEDGLL